MLSVVIPSYNEQEMVPAAAREIGKVLEQACIDYEGITTESTGSPPKIYFILHLCFCQSQDCSPEGFVVYLWYVN